MSTSTGWKQSVATTLLDELEWNDREASACCDMMEAGKYRYECEKIALVLRTLLEVQTLSRAASIEEREIMKADFRPASRRGHRKLIACRDSMTRNHSLTTNTTPQS